MNERIKENGGQEAALVKHINQLSNTHIKRLAVTSGIYDCITDPYDALKNGDTYSSVMPDLERFAKMIIQECIETLRLVPYNSDRDFGDEVIYQDAVKNHFGVD